MIANNDRYLKATKRIAELLPSGKIQFLITGANGLIGSCLVDILLEANKFPDKDYKVYALGRSLEKLNSRFFKNENLIFLIQDIISPLDIGVKFDYIIHAASPADPKSYALYPVETILTNVLGTKNMLDYCKNNKDTRLFLCSTFEVYGKHNNDVYYEHECALMNFNELRSCYPESKRTSELLVKSYIEEYGVDAVIGRFSSVYGPTMLLNDSKAHAQFIKNALKNENIVLKSEGKQVRNYTYVLDACEATLLVLFKGKTGEAYNIASSNSVVSIAEVAKTVAEIVNTKVIFDLPDDIEKKGFSKPQNCILDTTKITNLGFNPKYNIYKGLGETIDILHSEME